jgi:hypothetical protein
VEASHRARLVQELAGLTEDERRELVAQARHVARAKATGGATGRTVPWALIRSAIGVMHGDRADAVEDCERLHDG